MKTGTSLVLLAHGSRLESANREVRDVAAALAVQTGAPVVPAFLELAEPSLTAALEKLIAAGHTRLLVLPYFLTQGRHLSEDIPRLLAETAGRHAGVSVRLLDYMGKHAGVVDLLADIVAAAPS